MFSSRRLESRSGDVVLDVVVDHGECLAARGRGLRLVGGGERSEQAVVELGVEDRDPLALGGELVGVGVLIRRISPLRRRRRRS